MNKKFDVESIRRRQKNAARATALAGVALLLVGLWISLYTLIGYLIMIVGFVMVDWTARIHGKGLFRNNIPLADRPWWKK